MKLVYQAYGRSDIVQQVLFSVASLKSFYPEGLPLTVEIYTDRKADLVEFFQGAPKILIQHFTEGELQEWRGEIQFVHRVKLEILKRASLVYGTTGSEALVYLDGDTFFKSKPHTLFSSISNETSLMHLRESSLREGLDLLTRKIAKFVKGKSFVTKSETIKIGPETEMWNAGVIGVSAGNSKLFQPMIDLTDALYSKYQKHVMEQLAVSYYLNRETKVIAADSVIHHYWDQKPEYDQAISDFILKNPSFESAASSMAQFPWPPKKPAGPAISPGFFASFKKAFRRLFVSK